MNTYSKNIAVGKNPPIKTAYKWPTIILLLIFFFPVGIYLLYKRFTYDRAAIEKNYSRLKNTGVVLTILAVMYFILGISGAFTASTGDTDYSPAIMMPIIFGSIAFAFFRSASNTKKRGQRDRQYISTILNQKQFSIDMIASTVGVTYETAVSDLQKMIEEGYFPGAFIDETAREIILPEQDSISGPENKKRQIRPVLCKGCGAKNKVVPGKTEECEYCGLPLELEG